MNRMLTSSTDILYTRSHSSLNFAHWDHCLVDWVAVVVGRLFGGWLFSELVECVWRFCNEFMLRLFD